MNGDQVVEYEVGIKDLRWLKNRRKNILHLLGRNETIKS